MNWFEIKYKLNIYKRYMYWYKKKCIFIHVPKAAGTSINLAIYGKTLGHYPASTFQVKFPNLFQKSFKFSFVRNPWDRVLSAYRFALKGNTESMGVRNPQQYEIPEFSSFESFLKNWLVKQDVTKLDFIFRPQYNFLYDEYDNLLVDYVGKVETLESDLMNVESKLGFKIPVLHSNKTSQGSTFQDEYLNVEMINIVRDIYSKDIELFGYEF